MRMNISGDSQQVQQEFAIDPEWRRYVVTGNLPGTELVVHFGLQINQGNQVDLFGMQVEPQTGASRYKKTMALNGVHQSTRYDQDELKLTSNRPDEYSTTIRLVSREPL